MIISSNFFVSNLERIFQVTREIFLHMQIVMIITGVDITQVEHFSNEWIELLSHI